MPHYLHTLALHQLQALGDHIRLVVIHPNYLQQRFIMVELMKQGRPVYLRLEGQNLSLIQIQDQIETAIAIQRALTTQGKTLILDECDRADPAAFEHFLAALFEEAPPARIFLFGRNVFPCLSGNSALANQTVFVPNDRLSMLWDYTQHREEPILLEVRAFGEGRVLINGQLVEQWDGMLPRSLFFYLIDRGLATRAAIFSTFWPDKTTAEATNIFHVTKRKIKEVLGADLTTYWSGFYRLSPSIHLSYDAVLFTELLQTSAVTPLGEAVDLLTRAAHLYRGEFLGSIDMAWTQNRRSELAEEYGKALAGVAKSKEDAGNKQGALSFYLCALSRFPGNEDSVRNAMRLYDEMGKPSQAMQVYACLVDALGADSGLMPSDQLQALAQTIRQKISANP